MRLRKDDPVAVRLSPDDLPEHEQAIRQALWYVAVEATKYVHLEWLDDPTIVEEDTQLHDLKVALDMLREAAPAFTAEWPRLTDD